MFGVCDGHGPSGKEAANFCKFALNKSIEDNFPEEARHDPETIIKALKHSFGAVHYSLKTNVGDCSTSGSTGCCVLTLGNQVITANTGSSRALILDKSRKFKFLTPK